jgi:Icc-related predicted phosphoesterase
MEFHLGMLELMGFAATIVGAGWTLLKISLTQFEKRLDERFKLLDVAVGDVKRLELDIVRSDTRNAQMYVTKSDHDRILERIFKVLESMEAKLDVKANSADCDNKMMRHLGRQ